MIVVLTLRRFETYFDPSAAGAGKSRCGSRRARAKLGEGDSRLHLPAICMAPQYLAEDMLRLEGFSQIEYVEMGAAPYLSPSGAVLDGRADFSMETAPVVIPQLEAGRLAHIDAQANGQVGVK